MNIWAGRHPNVSHIMFTTSGYYSNETGCCIYHKPRDFDQSSSSSDDDSDQGDDNKCGCHEHRVAKKKIKKR